MKYKDFLNILYIIILLVVIRQVYLGYHAKKAATGKLIAYYTPQSKFLIGFLSIMLMMLGAYTLVAKDYFGAVYLLSGIGFAYISYQKIYFYEDGILYNTKFTTWDKIKKWGYNDTTKNLEILTNATKSPRQIIPISPDNKDEVMTIIKRKKKNK
ncbi:DUF5673 domain-containing protein [Mediannikoviicoccus vaginalis]|uniref:DUF5673 domain-containing protein n=1 Tax=Mediannikoviicoccus vaginalis TaxID=2899727 RepID=UPI001F399F40|nr:DUF5673 domain-containing protein [Mediannikoviicoccus vaginalis]